MSQENKLDLFAILSPILRALRKLWIWILVLAVVFGGLFGLRSWRSYSPRYTASTTFTIYIKNSTFASVNSYNSATAEQMAKTFPYILTSGVLSEMVKEELGMSWLPAISASAQSGANLFTLSVSGSDPQLCYDVLQSVIRNYPEVAQFVVGPTEMILIDETGVPSAPVNQRTWRPAAQRGAILGGVVAFGLIALYGLTKITVMGREDLQKYTNANFFGALPQVRAKKRSKKSPEEPFTLRTTKNRAYIDAFQGLAQRLDKHIRKERSQVLMVCSSIPGEGKTTVSASLAYALGDRKRRVLLIDCDLRKPSLFKMFRQRTRAGLGEVVHGKAMLEDVLYQAVPGRVDVLFGGKAAHRTDDLFASPRFRELMLELRQRYDVILLDTPPVSILADTEELSQVCDGAVMVIKQNFASRSSVVDSMRRLSDCGVPVVGYLLNAYTGSMIGHYNYGYGYGSGYGYGYGYGRGYGYGSRARRSTDTED